MTPFGTITATGTVLASLLGAVGANQQPIWISQVQNVTANMVIPQNVQLRFLPGGQLKPANGVTITMQGTVDASPNFHIFDLSLGGTVTFVGNVLQREFFADWWILPYDGTDAQPALTKMIAAVPDFSTIKFAAAATLTIGTEWLISNRTGIHLIAAGSRIEETPSVTLSGTNTLGGGTAIIRFGSCGHCKLEGFKILENRAAGTAPAIAIDTNGPNRISTNNTIAYNRIENVTGNTLMVGIRLAPSGEANNEGMQIIGNFFWSNVTGTGTAMYLGAGSNNHQHFLYRNATNNFAIGIDSGWGGFYALDCISEFDTISVRLSHLSYPTVLDHFDVESSTQFLVTTGAGGESQITMRNCRLAGLGANGVAWIDIGLGGPVTIDGNDYQNYTGNNSILYRLPWSGGAQPGDSISLRNNNYSNLMAQGFPQANVLVRTGSAAGFHRQVACHGDMVGALQDSFQYSTLAPVGTTITLNGDPVAYVTATGGITIDTITLPVPLFYPAGVAPTRMMKLIVIPVGGAITWAVGSNVLRAGTTAQNQVATLYYDPTSTKWLGDY